VRIAPDALQVAVERVFPFGQNHRLTILGREYQMEEEAGVGRGHDRALLAPRWGAFHGLICSGGVAALNHRVLAVMPLASKESCNR